jgi:SAM-dependent methyltransferase
VVDLESSEVSLGDAAFDVIVGVHYLHRPLFPALLQALRPGGLLIYETFTRAQAQRGRPTNPDFLLEPGELISRVAPLEVVSSREGRFDELEVASVIARKQATSTAAMPKRKRPGRWPGLHSRMSRRPLR